MKYITLFTTLTILTSNFADKTFAFYGNTFTERKVGDVINLNKEIYNSNQVITADKVVFMQGGSIRINNGAVLTVNAREIEVQSAYTIDARGSRGVDATGVPADWCAHNCNCGGNGEGQKDYDHAGSPVYDIGIQGGKGSNGGTVIINYCTYSGINGGIANLHVYTSGGPGGSGSRGRKLIDPCHTLADGSKECKYGPNGKQGDKGDDGIFRYNDKYCQ